MNKLCLFFIVFFLLVELPGAFAQDSIQYSNFGYIAIYKPAGDPDELVLFISGDGGWKSGVTDMASQLASKGAMVAGINIVRYVNNLQKQQSKCYYPASDFESLSLYLQKKFRFPDYHKPILMGYSSGATLAYGILAQAPANTFKGTISLGFCPDIEIDKPLCNGTALKSQVLKPGKSWNLEPSDKLTAPFIVLLGPQDKVCSFDDTQLFMKKVNTGEFIPLPKVGHGFAVQKNWLPQMLLAYEKVKKSASYPEMMEEKNQNAQKQITDTPDSDLPLTIVPAHHDNSRALALFISGDGGWTSFDQGVADKLSESGIPVIGLDSQKYFWKARTPEVTTGEIVKALQYYLKQWNKESFIICGYSFGADLVPFILTRLPADLDPMLKGAVMLSPDPLADFEIHIADMLHMASRKEKYDVPGELKKLVTKHVTCIFGEEEDKDDQKLFKESGAEIKLLPGTHHYNNNYDAISGEILNSCK
jgi:type IV secretory pathway VirJ component